jgi:hypothetical protein
MDGFVGPSAIPQDHNAETLEHNQESFAIIFLHISHPTIEEAGKLN